MKKYFVPLFVLIALFSSYPQQAKAERFYVRVQPNSVTVRQSPRPSAKHIWIADEWVRRGGRYERVIAHWETPPPHHKNWVQGRWERDANHGYYWIAGHWG
ncbi:hypothetical protein Syn7502_03326 [Synechococcus sp. PCC 7502]|uniref:hypothetical protein n=1 Tax=Synechococcus sp. PCC 7502 TaxID=1173263 RepID=UPI00029FE203|nr:hypothetical protein [Synechococcus sp. PCC 7502]AFY75190.1 hypothetical protein Syn7502_03326 [Synechococcus sp. PCC 7502]